MTLFPQEQLKLLGEKEYAKAIEKRMLETKGPDGELAYEVNKVFKVPVQRSPKTPVRWLTSTSLKGLPDLMAVGFGVTIWCEVKTAGGAIDAQQIKVLLHFAEVETNRCWVVRPTDDLQAIANWIARPGDAPRTFGFDAELLERARANTTGSTRAH